MISLAFAREIGILRWVLRTMLRQFHKRVIRVDSRMRLPTGSRIILPRSSQSASEVFVADANIDWGAEALFSRFAERDHDALDIGSHIGYYAIYLSPLVRRVYAFEPDHRNIPSLAANVALVDNVALVPKAVSDKSGTVRFSEAKQSATSGVRAEGRAISAVSVDDFVVESGASPRLIKIDVEGHDLAVVKGAERTMRDLEPLILAEFNQGETTTNDAESLFELCAERGYSLYANVWAEKQPLVQRHRTEVIKIDRALFSSTRTKMLFLVPRRLVTAFEAEASPRQ